MSEASAFKKLYSSMIQNGGDFSKVSFKGKNLKCFVKESFPYFLVTDNHFFVPAYLTKKALDDFKSKNSGVNVTDLKSKVVEIVDWSLEMAKVDSSSVFTSYAGIEIRLIVNSLKLIQDTKSKVLLSRYPVNLYRDDEMKTLFQAYHHSTLAGRVGGKDSLPDITKKGDSIVAFATGSRFVYPFKVGTTQTVDLVSIYKAEKGGAALKKLQDGSSSGGHVKVVSGVRKSAKKAAPKASAVKAASRVIAKASVTQVKKSVAKVGKSVPRLMTPGGQASAAQTPKMGKSKFDQMKAFLKKHKK